MPRKYTRKPIEQRFWSKVDKNGPIPLHRPDLGPCWLWLRYLGTGGYGNFHLHGRPVAAHRVAYILSVSPVPDELHVLHHCDNRQCVNPSHLFLGTNLDNIRDRLEKGRFRHVEPLSTRHKFGARNGMARLNDRAVVAIRAEAENGRSQAALAREYGVTISTIHLVVKRKTWRHI